MLEPLGNLIRRWRADPRPATTLALCQGLAEAGEAHRRAPPQDWHDYVATCAAVGHVVAERFTLDLDVLLAAGRMHLAAGATWDAQSATLQVAKIAPEEPRAWVLLGEALLRRGDAARAERSLGRAAAAGVAVDPRLLDLARRLAARPDTTREVAADAVARALGYGALPPPPGAVSMPPGPASAPPAAILPRPAATSRSFSGLPMAPGAEESGEATVRREIDPDQLRALLEAADDLGRRGVTDTSDPRAQQALERLRDGSDPDDAPGDFDDSLTSQLARPMPPPPRAPIHSDAFTLVRPAMEDDATTETGELTVMAPSPVARPRDSGGASGSEMDVATVMGRVPQEILAQLRELERADFVQERAIDVPRAQANSMDEVVPTLARQLAPRSQDTDHHPLIEDATTERRFLDDPSSEDDGDGDLPRTLDIRQGMLALPRPRQPAPAPAARVILNSQLRRPAPPPPPNLNLPTALPAPVRPVGPAPPPTPYPTQPSPRPPLHEARLPGLLEDMSQSAEIPLPPGPPATSPSSPLAPADQPTERRRRPARRRLLGWLLTAGVLGVAGTIAAREWKSFRAAEGVSEAHELAERAREALLAGSLTEAKKLAEAAGRSAPDDPVVMRLQLDVGVVDVLDGTVSSEAAVDVLLTLRKKGVGGFALALAALTAAVGARNGDHALSILEQHGRDALDRDDAYYRLVEGAAFDLLADPAAVDAYAKSRALEPKLSSAAVRHVRALVFAGRVGEARTAATDAPVPASTAKALAVLLARGDRPDRWPDRDARIAREVVGDLPRPLRAIGAALAMVPVDTAGSNEMGLDVALDDADGPAALLLCGQLALSTGDLGSAAGAADRAIALRAGWTPAHALKARVLLMRGELEQALALEPSLPPAVAAELRAIAAYEAGDPEALAEAESRAVEKGAARWPALALALSRIRSGAKRPPPGEADGLLAEGVTWADVLAIDLATDAGDLPRARAIAKGFRAPLDPARALRLARLRRVEGDLEAAKTALARAGKGRVARVEEVLLAAESKDERKKMLALLEGGADPVLREMSPFALAYLRGREGAFQAAKAALAKTKRTPEAPLEFRVLRLLGLAAARETGPAEPLLPLVEALRGRPEVVWAGVMIGVLPPNKMPRGMP